MDQMHWVAIEIIFVSEKYSSNLLQKCEMPDLRRYTRKVCIFELSLVAIADNSTSCCWYCVKKMMGVEPRN